MPSSEEKRAAIIDRLAHALRDQGLGQTGLRGLATLAGTSDRMLIYYFGNKETLLRDVLDAMTGQFQPYSTNIWGMPSGMRTRCSNN